MWMCVFVCICGICYVYMSADEGQWLVLGVFLDCFSPQLLDTVSQRTCWLTGLAGQ